MKIFIKYITSIFTLYCIMSFAIKDDTSQLYTMALRKHLSSIENNTTSKSNKNNLVSKTLFIINECDVELPQELNNYKLQILSDSSNNFIQNNIKVHVVKVNPIKIYEGSIVIVISDYMATKSNDAVRLSYIGGKKYIFKYYSKSHRYKIIQTQILSF